MNHASSSFRDVTVGNLLTKLAATIPNNEALVYTDRNLRFTFSELEAEAKIIARGLMACGVARGERVAVWATNVPEWIVLQFALAKIGAILVTVNTALRAHEIDYLLRQSEAATLFTIQGFRDVDYLKTLNEIGFFEHRLPDLKRIFFLGENCPDGVTPYNELRVKSDEISDAQLAARESEVGLDDVINMQYTSGTTGFPKGVMLSSRNLVNNGYWMGYGLGYTPEDRLCLCVPLFHCFGCVIGVLGAYTHGACLCPVEFFEARRVLETIGQEKCTALYGVPTMFLAEMEDAEFSRFDLSTLRTGVMAGTLCPEPLMRRAISEMNLNEITIIYGLTEASPGITQTARDDSIVNRTQTVGRVLPEMEVKIIDPATGKTLGLNEPGELCVRGYNVMKGYFRDPEATRVALRPGGWLATGDIARQGDDGAYFIEGRLKELIIRSGFNVFPVEVEAVLNAHPDVTQSAVVGRPVDGDEEVVAFVELGAGARATPEALAIWAAAALAPYKRPAQIIVMASLPHAPNGKVLKGRLAQLAREQLA